MSLVAILNSIALCFHSPVQNYDTKRVNNIIVCSLIDIDLLGSLLIVQAHSINVAAARVICMYVV